MFLIVPILYAMPPMPGSGHTHDGSVFDDEEPASFKSSYLSKSSADSSSAKYDVSVSTTGDKTILVLLAEFDNLKFNDPDFPKEAGSGEGVAKEAQNHNAKYYKNLLQDGSELTMRKYYQQQSRGLLNLSFLVLGPYTASHDYEYYGENDQWDNDILPGHFVFEILTLAKSDAKAAAEAEGVTLDNCTVIIIHAGPGEEEKKAMTNLIWSHRSSLTKRKKSVSEKNVLPLIELVNVDDKIFDDYIIVPEYTTWNGICEAAVGVFCHEFGHILGLPDAYDTYYSTAGVGQWSLMAGGSWGSVGRAGTFPCSDPSPLMAWERLALGWIDEVQIAKQSGIESYTFKEINSDDKVYTVKLADDQFLLFEGKAKNMTGTGMCVMETGLMITHIHKGILSKYWSANTINSGSYRPHGAMVVEAEASNYKTKGLGNLWREDSTDNRFTTTALFRRDTLTSVSPSDTAAVASGFLIGILAAWYRGRKKLCALLAVIALVTLISTGCVISAGGGGGTYDTGPNTNYYTNMSNVHSKTGNSGISIYNIKCNSDGSGSFTIRREE